MRQPAWERRCGVRAGRRPEPSAAGERDAVPGLPSLSLGLGRGGFTIQFTPAGNIQNHPRAAVYKAPEFAGGRSCRAPAQLPHQAVVGLMRNPRLGRRTGHCPDRDPAAVLER